jgi:NNP family nitrate/nitrite transporter-like MFS transporter
MNHANTKWRTLALATAGFNVSVIVWFSFAPFTGPIGEDFGLSLADLAVLASAAIWLSPPGRAVTGWLADRFGATDVFAAVLAFVGVSSIASASATDYAAFFAARLEVAAAGVTFVVGVQHVVQWFPDEQLGFAQGVYAGLGNTGAAAGAFALPRLFGADWRSAFVATGVAALAMAGLYYALGTDAPTESAVADNAERATLSAWVHVATRYSVVALALGYALSFGLEISMNSWLPTYFREGFGTDLVVASTFAAAFPLASGLLRPVSGYVSDRLARQGRNVLPWFTGRYREQWTLVCMAGVILSMGLLTAVGATGAVLPTVAVVGLVGLACGFTNGAIFAQVPAMFPDRSGSAAGVVGGVGTVGGVAFPVAFAAVADVWTIHGGYAVVAVAVVPILLLNAWVARPVVAARANTDGFVSVGSGGPTAEPGGD